MLTYFLARDLLKECDGDLIWPVAYCRKRGVPESWIEALADAHESNPQWEPHSIYLDGKPVNQFEGIRDIDLACKLAEFLGLNVESLRRLALTRRELVRSIQESVDE